MADVTVLPVPGGPWMRLSGLCSTVFTAYTCKDSASARAVTTTAPPQALALGAQWHLRVVEVGEPLSREALRQLALDDHILHLMAEQLVVDIP